MSPSPSQDQPSLAALVLLAGLSLVPAGGLLAAYRDAECDRQLAFVAGRNHPDIGELGCKIRQTAQRIADLKFDE